MPASPAYIYSAKIVGIGPKGFITARLDLGFGMSIERLLRVNGISEREGASKWMVSYLLDKDVVVRVVKDELGYGAEVFLDLYGQEVNLSDELLRRRLAALFVS